VSPSDSEFVRKYMDVKPLYKCKYCGEKYEDDCRPASCILGCDPDSLEVYGYEETLCMDNIMIYNCAECKIFFAVNISAQYYGGNIWLSDCVFIETLNGRNKRQRFDSHIYGQGVTEIHDQEIESVTTSLGVYNRL
jgi:hypothetical protein